MAYQLKQTDEQEMQAALAMLIRKSKTTHQRPDGAYYTYTSVQDLYDRARAEGDIWGEQDVKPQFGELIARYYRLEEYRKKKGEIDG